MTLAFTDVCYGDHGARAACVLADSWTTTMPTASYATDIADVAPYEPGQFFRRELPCLLAVLHLLPSPPSIVIVDGYVWLSSKERPGLGAHLHTALHEALQREIPVVGIAKTAFDGVDQSTEVVQVLRGSSQRPLFVSAVGMEASVAAQCVRQMAGEHRIPELLRCVDHLARGYP